MTIPAFVVGEGVTALALIRSLGRRSIPVYLFGAAAPDIASRSRYLSGSEPTEGDSSDRVIGQIARQASSLSERPVLLCTADKYLEAVAARRGELDRLCRINLPPADIVSTIVDKSRFDEFCRANDLPAPRSWVPATEADIDACLQEATLPVAVKPVFSHAADAMRLAGKRVVKKFELIGDVAALRKTLAHYRSLGLSALIQEYIVGPDNEHYSFLSYRTSDNRELAGFGVRKLRIYPVHGGAASLAEISNDRELAEKARAVVDKLRYNGASSICFKRDSRTQRLMIHEANGRFPVWHSASRLCGIDLPVVVYEDAAGRSVETQSSRQSRGRWISIRADVDAFREYRRCGELRFLSWLRSLFSVRVWAEFSVDDWRPFIRVLQSWLSRFWRRVARQEKRV